MPRHLHAAGSVGGIAGLGENDLVTVDVETGRWSGELEPPAEVHLHTETYGARPEARAVVHTHAEHPMAGINVLPVHHHSLQASRSSMTTGRSATPIGGAGWPPPWVLAGRS